MKKSLSIGLALLMSFSLVACGSEDGSSKEKGQNVVAQTNPAFIETMKEMKSVYEEDIEYKELSVATIYDQYIIENYGTRITDLSGEMTWSDGFTDSYKTKAVRYDSLNKVEDNSNYGKATWNEVVYSKGDKTEKQVTDVEFVLDEGNNTSSTYTFMQVQGETKDDEVLVSATGVQTVPLVGDGCDYNLMNDNPLKNVVCLDNCEYEMTFEEDCVKLVGKVDKESVDEYFGPFHEVGTIEAEFYDDHMTFYVIDEMNFTEAKEGYKQEFSLTTYFSEGKELSDVKDFFQDIVDLGYGYEGQQDVKVDTGWSVVESTFSNLN